MSNESSRTAVAAKAMHLHPGAPQVVINFNNLATVEFEIWYRFHFLPSLFLPLKDTFQHLHFVALSLSFCYWFWRLSQNTDKEVLE